MSWDDLNIILVKTHLGSKAQGIELMVISERFGAWDDCCHRQYNNFVVLFGFEEEIKKEQPNERES